MLLELHIIQNFAPANLNRDDTGSPKDCEFGGYTRARISSQALKRAIREHFRNARLIAPEHIAVRTARAVEAVRDRLVARGRPPQEATVVAQAAMKALVKMDSKKPDRSSYLLFLTPAELDGLAAECLTHWDDLAASNPPGGKNEVKLPEEVKNALLAKLDGKRAADLALFGRMIADKPDKNVDGSSQVAHAISTNRVSTEFDYFTAVDDLKTRDEDAGAGMIGQIEFNSACFYRYANVDVAQLAHNIGADAALTTSTLRAFMRAAVDAIPTGKQNSMAAHNPPSLVMSVVRESGQWNLANAFVKPARASGERDLVQDSICKLDAYWKSLTAMYGTAGIRQVRIATMDSGCLTDLKGSVVASSDPRQGAVAALIEQTVAALTRQQG